MLANILVSVMALSRYDARNDGIDAKNVIEEMIDTHFPDERMKKILTMSGVTKIIQIYEEDKSKGIEWDRDFIPEEDKNVALETITQKIMAHKTT